mmetsp:Transcript_68287/g.209448  ORF Transcript_68287/g.209448 Transcript_68287/m.209448 type:complete len:211 (-) Transcript_68287:266-898(-)
MVDQDAATSCTVFTHTAISCTLLQPFQGAARSASTKSASTVDAVTEYPSLFSQMWRVAGLAGSTHTHWNPWLRACSSTYDRRAIPAPVPSYSAAVPPVFTCIILPVSRARLRIVPFRMADLYRRSPTRYATCILASFGVCMSKALNCSINKKAASCPDVSSTATSERPLPMHAFRSEPAKSRKARSVTPRTLKTSLRVRKASVAISTHCA